MTTGLPAPGFLRDYISGIITENLASFTMTYAGAQGWANSVMNSLQSTIQTVNNQVTTTNTNITTVQNLLAQVNTSLSQVQTLTSQNAAAITSFNKIYLGDHTANPVADNLGNPLVDGAVYRNPLTGQYYIYNGNTQSWGLSDSAYTAVSQSAQTAAAQISASMATMQTLATQVQQQYAAITSANNKYTYLLQSYLPPSTNDPKTDQTGSGVTSGALRYNSSLDRMVYLSSSGSWVTMPTSLDAGAGTVLGAYGLNSSTVQIKAINYNTILGELALCAIIGGQEQWFFTASRAEFTTQMNALDASLGTVLPGVSSSTPTIKDLNAATAGWSNYAPNATNAPDTWAGVVLTAGTKGSEVTGVWAQSFQWALTNATVPAMYVRSNIGNSNGAVAWSSWTCVTLPGVSQSMTNWGVCNSPPTLNNPTLGWSIVANNDPNAPTTSGGVVNTLSTGGPSTTGTAISLYQLYVSNDAQAVLYARNIIRDSNGNGTWGSWAVLNSAPGVNAPMPSITDFNAAPLGKSSFGASVSNGPNIGATYYGGWVETICTTGPNSTTGITTQHANVIDTAGGYHNFFRSKTGTNSYGNWSNISMQ